MESSVQDWLEVLFQLGNVFPQLDSLYTKSEGYYCP
jgi:hypothetical protein